MTDKLVFEADLDNSPILRAFEKVRAEALAIDKVMAELGRGTDLQAAMAQLATAATSSMQVVRQQLKTVETSVKAMQAQLASDAKAAGKALGDGVAAGVQESTGKVTSVVRAQAQWLQAAYEDELKKGVKFSPKDLMDFKAWGVNIGADAKARLRDMAQQASEEVRKATTQAKTEIAGHYDALGTFISNASAKAGVEASAANSRMLLLGPAEVSKATAQAQREIKVHYDALGRVVNAEAQAASVSAEAASRRMLMLDPATVRASTAQAQREIKVHYDALGRVGVASSADAAEAAAAANRRMLMLDPAVTRASTAQAQREIKVHYDALGRVIMTEAAKTAAATEAANRKALMLGAGDVRTAPGQLSSLHAETTRLAAASSKLDEAFSKQALSAKDLHSAYRGLASGFGAMWLTWGAALPLLTGAAVSSGVVQVIKQGAQVDQALQTIRVLSQESSVAVGDLRTQLLELARSGPFGPMEVAEAMKTLSLAGLNAAQVSASIKDVLNLAVAGNTSITQAADVMVSVGTAFGIAAEGYNYIGDVISKTAAVSKASVESVGEAFKTASVIHKQYGASLEDVGVGLAALSNLGIQGSAAGTALRNMYADLSGRSEKASAALKKYNLDLRDQYGNFKDVVTIAQEFDKALSKLDFKDVKNYLHTVFSERGAKPFIELLDQARRDVATARAAGDQLATVYSKLEELRDNIANSAGFAAISAAQMAMTPLNQMKAVASSLQATLVEAFDSVAPVIVAVGEQLRSVFASDEFKEALKTLVVSVAELTQFLVANFDAIVNLGKAYLAFKVAQGVGNIFGLLASGAASSAAAIGTLASSLPQATNAFSGLGVASSGAAAAAGGLATTVAGVARWLPVVGGIVQVAAGAWMLYEMYTSRAKSSQDSLAGSSSSDTYLNKLREETARLNENTEALMRNMTVAELRAEKDKGKARDTMAADSAKELAKAERSVLEARQAVADFDRQNKVVSGSNANYRKIIVNQLAAAESNLTKVKEDQYIKRRDIQEAEGRAIAAAMVNADKVKAKMAADMKAMSGMLGGLKFDPSEVAKHASALKEAHSNELSQIEKFYNTQLSLLDKFNADAGTRLKDELSAGLIEKGEYMARELKLTEQYETQKLQLLDKERAAYEAAYTNGVQKYLQDYDDWVNKHKGEKGFAEQQAKAFETLQQSLANTSRAAETFFEKNDAEKAKAQDTAFTRMHKQTVELQGSIEKLKKDTQNFWEAEEVLSKKAATQAGVEDALRYASPQAAAYISAAAKETEHLTDRVYKYDEAIRQATIDMDAYVKAVGDDANWNATLIAGYEDRKKALAAIREERSKLLEAIPDRAAEKGKLAVEKYWKDWEADLVKGITGAVMVGLFDGGKSGAKALRAVIIAELKRPIQVVVQALVQPITGTITSALGFSGAANAASGISGASGLFSAGSTLAGVSSFMGELGTGLLASTQTALGLTATAAQASYAASMGVAAQTGSLIGSLGPLISAAPYLVALAGVYMLAKNLDHSGTPHTGGGSAYSAAGGLLDARTSVFNSGFTGIAYSDSTTDMTAKLVQSIVGILDTTATTFGKQAGYMAAASFADDSSKDGAWGSLFIRNLQGVIADWQAGGQSFRTFSDGSAGSAEYLAAVSQDVRAALDGIDLPEWADKMLGKLGASASLEDLSKVVAEINATQVVLKSLGASVKGFAGLSGEAVLGIINASGGLQQFSTAMSAYYENFYSEQEKFDAKLASLNTRLQEMAAGGAFANSSAEFYRAITEPTRENFRKLIEAQDLTTASGQTTYAALLSLSGVVAELTPVAEKAADAVQTLGTAATTLADVQKLFDAQAKTILNSTQYTAYRIQQIQATLSAAGMDLSAAQITHATREQVLAGYQQALAAGNLAAASAILNVVDALTEVSAGFQGVTTESTSAAAAVQKVVTTLADVQTQFGSAARTLLNDAQYTAYQVAQIQATLGSVGINVTAADIQNATKEQVLAGLGEMMAAGNLDAARAILSVVDALSQVSSGFQTVAATASNAAAVMQQRAGLESTLLNLTGNTAAIRERELAALDVSNRGLQQHIYAIQDAQAAVQSAQQAVNDATSAYQAQESAISNLQSAAQKWIGTMATATSLLDQISGSLGGAGGNREAQLWATVNGSGDIDERLRAAQELYSVITQTAATEQAAQDNALANAKALLDYGHRLRDYVQGLKTGDLSTLTPAQKVAEALAQYQTTLAAARGGDQTALGNLQGVADTYLRLAREFDPASYTASVFTSVTDALDQLGAGLISSNDPQVTLLQAQLDATQAASGSANALSADQIERLRTLQGVVQDLYAQAGAQSAIANAQVSSAQANLQTLGAAQLAAQQTLAARQQAVVDAQNAATAYMATLADVAVADPVPDILRALPEGIAAALAPLLNANPASTAAASAAAVTAQRAQIIRDYAATLPQDDTGARMLYDAAVANGVSSAELDAAMGFAPGSSLAWAVAHNLPAFAQGTNYVPRDMVAQIHQGEAIVPARYNPANGGNAELVAEIKALREEVRHLREQNNAGHQLGAMATEHNTASLKKATEDSANQIAHITRLQQRAALA